MTEFSIHGLVGIRLLEADERDTAVVSRQLGLQPSVLTDDPDITIRFTAPGPAGIRHLKRGDAGFTDEGFCILDGNYGKRRKAIIPFDRIGQRCEIICEHGISTIPLLTSVINLTMLNKGILPVHASAFVHGGTGVLVNGWPRGGKTGMLLAFMNRGARYISDDWVYIRSDRSLMHGLPEPIQIRDWYIRFLPQYRSLVSTGKRVELAILRRLLGLTSRLAGLVNSSSLAGKVLKRINLGVEGQLAIDVHPHALFGDESCIQEGHLEKVFLSVTHDRPDIVISPARRDVAIRRISSQLLYEQQTLMSYYLMYCYAFPDRTNSIIEHYAELQRELLEKILADKEIYDVYHPFRSPLPDMYDEISPFLKQPASGF